MYSHDKVWVHAIKTLQHAGRGHRTLPPAQHCNTQWLCLLQNWPRHVWAPVSGDHCTGTIGKKAEGTRLQLEQIVAWAMDTWVASNHLFSCCWQLLGQIHLRRTCPAPSTNGAKILYVLIWKRRGKILPTHHQVGLCWQEGAPFNAIICWEGIKALSTSPTSPIAVSAVSAG